MENHTPVASALLDPIVNLVEENAIRKLENYYLLAVDTRNFDVLGKVFTEDVIADFGPGIGVLNGVDSIATTLQKMTAPVKAQHTLTTQIITVCPSAPSEAFATSYVVANQFGQGDKEGKSLVAYVRYDDKLLKGTDGWKISRRTLTYMGPHAGDISIFRI